MSSLAGKTSSERKSDFRRSSTRACECKRARDMPRGRANDSCEGYASTLIAIEFSKLFQEFRENGAKSSAMSNAVERLDSCCKQRNSGK